MPLNIRNKAYHFQPNWTMTVLALLFLALFFSLGIWQLKRAEEKRQLLSTYESRIQGRPIPWPELRDYQRYQSVKISGHYLPFNFLLDNKVNRGEVGYEVLTAFMPVDSNKVLLINRGWIAAGKNRQIIPEIAIPSGELELHGLVYFPLKKTFTLAKQAETGWPRRIQALDFTEISQTLNKAIYPLVILLNADAKHGFSRDWQPVVATSSYKHVGYAAQWFLFAFVLVILYIVLSFRRLESAND